MFDPKTDRLVYGDLLTPPPGYTLETAICTTYSLDLETLIASLVALGLNEATDTELLKSPVNTLHAIEKVSQRVLVFCESGQTRIPSVSSPLFLLLEKMIVPVALSGSSDKSDYPSFHPKTWTIRYVSRDEKPLYRFIVLSRNLTFDRSWDMVVSLEGQEESGGKRKVKPLLDFLAFLKNLINSIDPDAQKKRTLLEHLASSIEAVRFKTSETKRPFNDYEIIPLGIGESSYNMFHDELFDSRPGHGIHDIVTISPFISKGVIQRLDSDSKFLTKSTRRVLITRRSELEKLNNTLKNTDVYVMKDSIVDGENALSDDDNNLATCKQDIHAKAYLSVKNSDVRILIGSMNASENGLGRNVEMMVRLYTSRYYLNRDSFLRDLMGDDKACPFTKINLDSIPKSDNKEDNQSDEQKLKRFCRLKINGRVSQVGDLYDITLTCRSEMIPERVKITPLRAKGLSRVMAPDVQFTGLRLLELSEFYIVSVGESPQIIERLVMIPTKDLPQEREKRIITEVINDKHKFAEYVTFVLGDTSAQVLHEMVDSIGSDLTPHNAMNGHLMNGLYERMLRVASDNPERLKEIGRLVELIDNEEIVTREFKQTYRTFMSALNIKYNG